MNKRDFIGSAGAGALAVVALPIRAAVPAAIPEASSTHKRRLPPIDGRQSLAAWRHYVGHDFELASGAAMRLSEVVVTPHAGRQLEQFRLNFTMKTGPAIVDGTQELRHTSGQRFQLFIESSMPREAHALFSLLA